METLRAHPDISLELDTWARHAIAANGFGDAGVATSTEPETRRDPMQTVMTAMDSKRYAKAVEVSKRIHWEIDRDVLKGREFDFTKKFLPDGLSKVDQLEFLSESEKRLLSQIQGRTYANIFGLVERFIAAKVLELSREYWLGDQNALEALVRFGDEEIKHQELFRRVERMCASGMPPGYTFAPEPNAVATAVLSKSTWAVLALTCHIELFVLAHYRQSIDPAAGISDLWKDVFLFHWREESQHAILDELEWRQEHARLSAEEIDKGVTELIELVGAIDGILKMQAAADTQYFARICGRALSAEDIERVGAGMLAAYRWQYILSGVQEPRFAEVIASPSELSTISFAAFRASTSIATLPRNAAFSTSGSIRIS